MSTEQRAIDLKAQISSLNSELKDTNEQIGLAHAERDGLSAVNLQLKSDLGGLANEIQRSRERIIISENKEKKVLERIAEAQKKLQDIESQILAKNQVDKDTEKAKLKLKEEEDGVARLQLVGQNLGLEIRKTLTIKDGLYKEIEEYERTLEDLKTRESELLLKINKELKDFHNKKKELVDKTRDRNNYFGQQDKSIKGQLKDLKTKERDLNIVKGRLKRNWPKNKPFPKI